jgi:DNA-binding CsgD family transcriptional regulator
MRPGEPTAAAQNLVDELRELARMRESHATGLRAAIEAVGRVDLFASLAAIVEALPLVVDADIATIRLSDQEGKLHLVAASGCPASEVRARAVRPLDLQAAMRLADPETLRRHAEACGFRWSRLRWLGVPPSPVGSLLLASRTERRPRPLQLNLLESIANALGDRLQGVKRTSAVVQACALRLARSAEPSSAGLVGDEVESLRPRERSILDLYADGLSTSDIAALLYISPHTVRTHVKSALKTLGLHNRADAARLVRTSQVTQLL